jgi:hypothetical protein
MSKITDIEKNKYENFNIDQLVPITIEITNGQMMLSEFIETFVKYTDNIYEIINELKTETCVSPELKNKINKNVKMTINNLLAIKDKCITLKNIGKYKGNLLDRFKKGFTYKYKLNNGIISENPEPFIFEDIDISPENNIIIIGCVSYQLSQSTDYLSEYNICNNSMYYDNYNDQYYNDDCDNNTCVLITGLENEIKQVQIIQANLNITEKQLHYFIETIKEDIIHFNLFDISSINLSY